MSVNSYIRRCSDPAAAKKILSEYVPDPQERVQVASFFNEARVFDPVELDLVLYSLSRHGPRPSNGCRGRDPANTDPNFEYAVRLLEDGSW
jgi:hypothetical protein